MFFASLDEALSQLEDIRTRMEKRKRAPFRIKVQKLDGSFIVSHFHHSGDAVRVSLKFLALVVDREIRRVEVSKRVGSTPSFHQWNGGKRQDLCARLDPLVPHESFGLHKFINKFKANVDGTILSFGPKCLSKWLIKLACVYTDRDPNKYSEYTLRSETGGTFPSLDKWEIEEIKNKPKPSTDIFTYKTQEKSK